MEDILSSCQITMDVQMVADGILAHLVKGMERKRVFGGSGIFTSDQETCL